MKRKEVALVKYECDYCGESFFDEGKCIEHEKDCEYKTSTDIKCIKCSFFPVIGKFFHESEVAKRHLGYYNKVSWYLNDGDGDEDSCVVIHEFDKINVNVYMPQHCFSYYLYTKNLDKEYEKEIFNKMHELIKKEVEKVIKNCDLINSKEFIEFKSTE